MVGSITLSVGVTLRRTGVSLSRIISVNVKAPNSMGGGCKVVRCTGGLKFSGIPTGSVLRSGFDGPVCLRGSTGYTTLNRTGTNTNRKITGFITIALNANINDKVIMGNGLLGNYGSTTNRTNRVIVFTSKRRYAYNEGNY